MKRFFLIFFAVFFYMYNLSAFDGKKIRFDFSTSYQLLNGFINEYVFDKKCLNTDNKESELDWDVKNISAIGFGADIFLFEHGFAGLSGKFAVSQKSGSMQDYDWLNSLALIDKNIPDSWYNNPHTELTNYSKHDNHLAQYHSFEARVGWNFYLPFEITLSPFAAYQYEFIHFDGSDGYKTYKEDNWEQKDFYGKVISYKQEANAFLFGLTAKIDFIPKTSIKSTIMISPNLTKLDTLDLHYLRQTAFLDRMKNVFQLQANIEAQYIFTKYMKVGISASVQYIPLSKGLDYTRRITSKGNYAETRWSGPLKNVFGGTSRFLWSTGITCTFSL